MQKIKYVLLQLGLRSEKLKQHLAPDQNPRSGRQQAEILRSTEEIWYRQNLGKRQKKIRFYQLKTGSNGSREMTGKGENRLID